MGGIVLLFAASLLWWLVSPALFGVALMLLAFFALEKWNLQRVLVIFSPLVTYPATFLISMNLNISAGGNGFYYPVILWSCLLIFSALYLFLLKDFWKWTSKSGALAFLGFGLITVVVAFAQLMIVDKCQWTSIAEKGVLIEDIKFCQTLKLYIHSTNAYFEGNLVNALWLVMAAQAFIFAGMVVSYILKVVFPKTWGQKLPAKRPERA